MVGCSRLWAPRILQEVSESSRRLPESNQEPSHIINPTHLELSHGLHTSTEYGVLLQVSCFWYGVESQKMSDVGLESEIIQKRKHHRVRVR